MDDSQRALECLIILAWENLNFIQRSHDGVLLNKHRLFPSFDRVCVKQVDLTLPKAPTTPHLPVLEKILMMSSKKYVMGMQELRRHI